MNNDGVDVDGDDLFGIVVGCCWTIVIVVVVVGCCYLVVVLLPSGDVIVAIVDPIVDCCWYIQFQLVSWCCCCWCWWFVVLSDEVDETCMRPDEARPDHEPRWCRPRWVEWVIYSSLNEPSNGWDDHEQWDNVMINEYNY